MMAHYLNEAASNIPSRFFLTPISQTTLLSSSFWFVYCTPKSFLDKPSQRSKFLVEQLLNYSWGVYERSGDSFLCANVRL